MQTRSGRQRSVVLADLVDSEAFTVAVASLFVAFGLASFGVLCMLEFVRDGRFELCMVVGLVTLGAVVVPLTMSTRAIRTMRRRHRRLVRRGEGRSGDQAGRWKPDG